MLNAEYSSASKLPWSLWKKRLLFMLIQDCFFPCVDNGCSSHTQLPSEQPRSTDFFHKTDYIITNKILSLKESGPKVTSLPLVCGPESEVSVEVVVVFMFGSLTLLSNLKSWLFDYSYPFLLGTTPFLLMKNSLLSYWQVALGYKSILLIQIMLVNMIF